MPLLPLASLAHRVTIKLLTAHSIREFGAGLDLPHFEERNRPQRHVPGESSVGSSYGEARFIHDGMDALFLAASDTSSGNCDYNAYSLSDVSGSEISS